MRYDLKKFLDAQDENYNIAYAEIANGLKKTHWTWYIFPVMKGVSDTPNGKYYALEDENNVRAYFKNKKLKTNYLEMCKRLNATLNEIPIENVMSEAATTKIVSSINTFLSCCEDMLVPEEKEILLKSLELCMN